LTDTPVDTPPLPPILPDPSTAGPSAAFRVVAPQAALWFEPGSRHLVVSFDNLATVDDPYPRPPWLLARLQAEGYAVLGVQTYAKDWYRNADAAPLVRALAATGFFRYFERVVFLGASMGAFGALNLATLVPGATVIALSPQSTMSTRIAPFERRFGWAVRKGDWTTPAFLDARDAVPHLAQIVLLYDGRVPEDLAHARRLAAPNVQLLRIDHATHEAIRVVLKCGALPPLLKDVMQTGLAGPAFWKAMRGRRSVRKWARAMMEAVVAQGRAPRIRATATALLRQEDYLFAQTALRNLQAGPRR
jgi:hypothetical protein